MRVLIWATEYMPNIGGLAIMAHSLAVQLKRLGHDVVVISNQCEETLECKVVEMNQIKAHLFPFERALATGNLSLVRSILGQIDALLDHFAPDIVNIHGWMENFSFYQLRSLQKRAIPLCITVHGLWEQIWHELGKQSFALLAKTRAISTVSHAMMQSLLKACEIKHPSMHVIHNGMIPSPFPIQPIPREKELLAVGRLIKAKCFDTAFYAIQLLIGQYPDIRLTVVGEGEQLFSLLNLRDTLGLQEHIRVVGAIRPDRVSDYIDRAKLILVPSTYESFGLTALEAAMRGRPTIASDAGGLREVIEHPTTGLLVEPKNPDALAAAIQQLLENEEQIQRMGQAALLRAKEKFHIETCAQKYIQMYQEIL